MNAAVPIPPPCPAWCELPPGHPYGGGYDDDVRPHMVTVARRPKLAGDDDRIIIEAGGQRLPDGTERQIDRPHVQGYLDGDMVFSRVYDGGGLPPAELRELAAFLEQALTSAADRLEALG